MSTYSSPPPTYSSRKGMTLMEVLIAITLGALLIVAAVMLIAPALNVNKNATNAQELGSLSKELSDNVRAWAGGNWHNIASLATSSANPYYLNTSASPFVAVVGREGVVVGSSTYARYFYVSDAYRDSNGFVTSTSAGGNNPTDPSTKQITVVRGLSGPPAFIQSTSTTAVATKGGTSTFPFAVTAGNFIVAAVDANDSACGNISVTDSL